MNKIIFALLVLSFVIAACNSENRNTDSINQAFCGRWMTGDSTHPNRERYWFKKDGTFIDVFYGTLLASNNHMRLPEPKSWHIAGNQLLLTYSFKRSLLHFFRAPVQYTLRYTIEANTDSSIVLTTMPTPRYPEKIINLKRMKLNGKYIME